MPKSRFGAFQNENLIPVQALQVEEVGNRLLLRRGTAPHSKASVNDKRILYYAGCTFCALLRELLSSRFQIDERSRPILDRSGLPEMSLRLATDAQHVNLVRFWAFPDCKGLFKNLIQVSHWVKIT